MLLWIAGCIAFSRLISYESKPVSQAQAQEDAQILKMSVIAITVLITTTIFSIWLARGLGG